MYRPLRSTPATTLEYYLRLAYDDHDTTYLQASADGTLSVVGADEATAQAAPFTCGIDTAATRGQWQQTVVGLPNVAVHAHLLATGSVLVWGRRDSPDQSLDTSPPSPLQPNTPPAPPATCTPFLWDPSSGATQATAQPTTDDADHQPGNLFCSGHTLLADGSVFVVGGHLSDQRGLDQANIYNAATGSWTPQTAMNHGRWYPTAVTLPSGSVLVLSGSYQDPTSGQILVNLVPQLWTNGTWSEIAERPDAALDLYPRVHVASDGLAYLTGPQGQTWSLDVTGGGHWNPVGAPRDGALRDYAPSVMYDQDKILFVGGGNPPTPNAEIIDLGVPQPAWQATDPMHFPRRQHNATVLPDGRVLVTGGTRSGGAPGTADGFNNLDPGQPVHVAELWDPATGHWSELAAERVDRCYHSTALLLPDATVVSAGGGDFFPVEGTFQQNSPADSHRDAQVFRPPYLFRGAQPEISQAPAAFTYGQTINVTTPQAASIRKVSLVGVSSVTHSFNAHQRLVFLPFTTTGETLALTAPVSANHCPPGPYMLFLVDDQGVPSQAAMVRLSNGGGAAPGALERAMPANTEVAARPNDALAQHATVVASARGTKVVVGITGTCPYGIAACWGGANDALRRLDHVALVDPIPDAERSTGTVYLDHDGLPDPLRWRQAFEEVVHDSYLLRGFEVTVTGFVEMTNEGLRLDLPDEHQAIHLAPLQPVDNVYWDRTARAPLTPRPGELDAYRQLTEALGSSGGSGRATITGPLQPIGEERSIEVRAFSRPSPTPDGPAADL